MSTIAEASWHRNLRRSRQRARNFLKVEKARRLLDEHHGSQAPKMPLSKQELATIAEAAAAAVVKGGGWKGSWRSEGKAKGKGAYGKGQGQKGKGQKGKGSKAGKGGGYGGGYWEWEREWDPTCAICRGEDHWKADCPHKGVTCQRCGGEHLTECCRTDLEAKGKGKGNGKGQGDGGKGKGHKGKGQENATNLSPIPQPVFCKRCDHMNQPGTYWCIKTGCGGLCAKAKVPGGGDTSQDLTKQEKEAMQKADEWIQDNE